METKQDERKLEQGEPGTGGLDAEPEATGDVLGVLRLDSYGERAVIFESGLAAMLGRCPASLRRAWQERGELPTPGRAFGQYYWTIKALAEHFEKRLELAGKEREALARKVARLAP